jgi:hypothetical protein
VARRIIAVTEVDMATRTTIALEDDLNAKNARRFRAHMAPFITHARKAGRSGRRASRPASSREHGAGIRAWAKEHGIEVSDRGRIPASVIEQYEAR